MQVTPFKGACIFLLVPERARMRLQFDVFHQVGLIVRLNFAIVLPTFLIHFLRRVSQLFHSALKHGKLVRWLDLLRFLLTGPRVRPHLLQVSL